ncbi:MAG: biopolymer transporter ExbD [Proteobacteria bacterium]|nr:biopolymer transporter ExbD [Pseudomonadota bacterium]
MRLSDKPQKRARIEIIPLIDCMFLLLVFFIYSMLSMTVHRGIQVNLPSSETGRIDRQDYLSISITGDEKIFLNKREIPLPNLLDQLKREKEDHPEHLVFINADQSVRYQMIIEVLDRVRAAGLTRVSLATREKANEP